MVEWIRKLKELRQERSCATPSNKKIYSENTATVDNAKRAHGSWPLAHDTWPLALGPWPLALDPWPLALGPCPWILSISASRSGTVTGKEETIM